MDIRQLNLQSALEKAAASIESSGSSSGSSAGPTPEGSFAQTLKDSINEINNIQQQADQAVSNLVEGKSQDLHQTMIAVEKADLSFQLMMQVRNKILSAYEEIQRMQI